MWPGLCTLPPAATRQEATTMTRMHAMGNSRVTRSSIAWGKRFASAAMGDINAYVFAAVLIICSVAVGCSSDTPKPVTSSNQVPAAQPQAAMPAPTPAPAMQAENKPGEESRSQAARDRELCR